MKKWQNKVLAAVLALGMAISPALPVMAEQEAEQDVSAIDVEMGTPEAMIEEEDPEMNKMIKREAVEELSAAVLAAEAAENREVKALGIDVFNGNGDIDWKEAKAGGIDFAFIRVGWRGYGSAGGLHVDERAEQNLAGATAAGVNVGVYVYSECLSDEEALEEAKLAVDVIQGYNVTYPVVFDYEGYHESDHRASNSTKEERTRYAKIFCDYVESCGYRGMVYSSAGHFRNNNDWNATELEKRYDMWVAQYWISGGSQYRTFEQGMNSHTDYEGQYRFWQFSSDGRVPGVGADIPVDMDIEYYQEGEEVFAPDEEVRPDPFADMEIKGTEEGICLNWNEVDDAVGYYVYRSVNGGAFEMIANQNVPEFLDSSAEYGDSYVYRVTPYDDPSNDMISEEDAVYEAKLVYLAQPIISAVSNQSTGLGISWDSVDGAASYVIYRSENGIDFKKAATVKGNETITYTDKKVVSGHTYTYKMVAINGDSKSPESETMSADYLAAPVLTQVVNRTKGIRLTWDEVDGAMAYVIFRSDKGEEPLAVVTGATVYTDSEAVNGQTYTYRMLTAGEMADSAKSEAKTFTRIDKPVLDEVTALRYGVKISWKPVEGADKYYIYRKTSSGSWKKIGTAKATSLSYTDKEGTNNTTYQYSVKAYKNGCVSYYNTTGLKIKYKLDLQKYKAKQDVRYRSGAGLSYDTLGWLSTGDSLKVVPGCSKKADGYTWYRIYLGSGKYAYVAKNYIKKVN